MTGKSTLGRYTDLLERIFPRLACSLSNEVGSLVDAGNHLFLVLELREFGGDDTEDHVLVLGEVGKRLETASAGGVVLEVVCVYVKILESN